MTTVATPKPAVKLPMIYDPAQFRVLPRDVELFQKHLSGFVPTGAFDVHAHFYDLLTYAPGATADDFAAPTWVRYESYTSSMSRWMGDRQPRAGLFFPLPARNLDISAANVAQIEQARLLPESRCLLLVSHKSDPQEMDRLVCESSVAGFKVYHLFAGRPDTQNAAPEEYIPEWVWEISHRHGLCIMLHMVRSRSLADEVNQSYINSRCRKYPGAKLILAHAARGFCGRHTVEGLPSVRGLGNLYFDTSVACEGEAMAAIISTFGPTRLMFGSDFPVSEARGRAVNLGDSFHWAYEHEIAEIDRESTTLVGIESLLALREACRATHLRDSDIERIFSTNARDLLGLRSTPLLQAQTGQDLYLEAKKVIPGGTQLVSKRPEQYVPGKWPAYYSEARGCEVIDLDGRRYIDFATSGIGSCLLGYANPAVTSAVLRRVMLGSMCTLNSPEEVELAGLLLGMHPWAQRMRLGRSGGEALAIAIRIARARSKRDIVAFCGYHGWCDWYLAANLGSDNALAGHLLPGLSPAGVPQNLRGTTLPFTYNKIDELRAIAREHGGQLAAVIMEPVRAIQPERGFLEDIRQLCDDSGAILIFDEVTTGFRMHRGGVHLKLGVTPDLAVFAKALGSGHPIAAIIGRGDAMDAAQDSFISSTYWTEGVGPTAASATLREMNRIDVPSHVGRIGTLVRDGLSAIASTSGVPLKLSGLPAQMYLAFDHPQADALLTLFTLRMLEAGYLVGGAFYPTLAHNEPVVKDFLAAAEPALAEVAHAVRNNDVLQRLNGPVRHSGFRRLN